MNDLEMTRLCADAMGLLVQHTTGDSVWRFPSHLQPYDPLHDDEQMAALVKQIGLSIYKSDGMSQRRGEWGISQGTSIGEKVWNADLNRAIVECVAKMQKAKTS